MLDLIASILFFVALTIAAVLVWRRLPQAAAAVVGEPVCLGCGAPAHLMLAGSFVCPGCGRDVRQVGIAPARPRGFAIAFWQLVNYSAGLCVIALIVTGIVGAALPLVNYTSAETNYQFHDEPYQRLDISLSGRRSGKGPLEGALYADLYLNNGELVTLQVESPSRHYRLIDTSGRESPLSQDAFGKEAVLSWMAAGGMDRSQSNVRDRAEWMQSVIDRALGDSSLLIRTPNPTPHYFSSGGGSTGSSGPNELLAPLSVMGWSIVWLIGVWFILRRPKRNSLPQVQSAGARP